VAVGNREIFAYIGAHPEAFVLLVHRVNIHIVLGRSWEVLLVDYHLGLCAECEPWLSAELFLFIQGIYEVEVAQKSIGVGGRSAGCTVLMAGRSAEAEAFRFRGLVQIVRWGLIWL